jgi:hypothetical protein
MLKKIGIAVVVAVALLLGVIAMQPNDFVIERSTTMAAPAEVIFPFVNDFHNWVAWSPWEKMDLTMKKTYEGPDQGTGAKYAWAGTSKVGEGRMTITESKPPEYAAIKLEFLKPFNATNLTEFSLKPDGTATRVTWKMSGPNSFMGKAMSVFMSMDKMVGKSFEDGLASMKAAAEAEAKKSNAPAAAEAEPKDPPHTH